MSRLVYRIRPNVAPLSHHCLDVKVQMRKLLNHQQNAMDCGQIF